MFAFLICGLLTMFVESVNLAPVRKVSNSRCSHSKYDIFIIVDGTKSIGKRDFKTIRRFLQKYVTHLDIGLGKTHVGLLLANDKRHTKVTINLGQHNSSETLSRVIGAIHRRGRRPVDMAYALDLVQKNVFNNKGGDRPLVRDILIIFTQRIRAINLEDVLKAAAELKSNHVEIITVPIHSTKIPWSFKDELTAIASIPQNILLIQPKRVKSLKKALVRRICLSKRALHPTKGCTRTNHDVFFLLDGSGSITLDYFNKMKQFLIKLIENLDVSPQGTHVGLLQFSHTLKTRIEFNLGELSTFPEIKSAILRMPYQSGGTDTGHALAIVNEQVFPEEAMYRPNVSDIVVILTDGEAQDRLNALNETAKLRQKGIQVVAVGMGNHDTVSSFRNDLQLMATTPNDVFTADYQNLPYITKALTSEICHARSPAAIKCSLQRSDILLIVDGSASVKATNMDKVKVFLKQLVLELNIGKRRNHIGLIQFSEAIKTRPEFHFNQYYDAERVGQAITKMEYHSGLQTMIGYALAMANNTIFTGRYGNRPDVNDVIILVADGGAHDETNAIVNAAKLKERGVKIITVYIPNSSDDSNGKELLRTIASSFEDAYTSDFDHLRYIAADIVKVVCNE